MRVLLLLSLLLLLLLQVVVRHVASPIKWELAFAGLARYAV